MKKIFFSEVITVTGVNVPNVTFLVKLARDQEEINASAVPQRGNWHQVNVIPNVPKAISEVNLAVESVIIIAKLAKVN